MSIDLIEMAPLNKTKDALLALKQGVDINFQNEGGYTALYWAAYEGHEDMVKFLLKQKGIDVNRASKFGGTPLVGCSTRPY